jgi:hypothetical protein
VPAAKLAPESLLGLPRDEVRRQLGEPDRSTPGFESFFGAGVCVDYDAKGNVEKASAARFVSGDFFPGKVLGVGLGDSKEACVAAWGEMVRVRKNGGLPYSVERWRYRNYVIEVEIWKRDGHDPMLGSYQGDTVKEITVWRQEPPRTG